MIPTTIKVNFDATVALRTKTAQHSRNIMERAGCEALPRYGKCYYSTPERFGIQNVPMIDDTEINALIAHWHSKRNWHIAI